MCMWKQSCDYLVTVIIEMAQMSQAHTALRNKVGWASVCVVGHVMTDVISKQDGQCVWAWTTQLCGKHWYTLGTHDAFLSWICGTGDDCRAVREMDVRFTISDWCERRLGPYKQVQLIRQMICTMKVNGTLCCNITSSELSPVTANGPFTDEQIIKECLNVVEQKLTHTLILVRQIRVFAGHVTHNLRAVCLRTERECFW